MRQTFAPTVYLLASHRNGTLYVGVTSDLLKRLYEHREGLLEGFTSDYGVRRLVWFEPHATMEKCHRSREADQEVEQGLEDQAHRRSQR